MEPPADAHCNFLSALWPTITPYVCVEVVCTQSLISELKTVQHKPETQILVASTEIDVTDVGEHKEQRL